MQHNCIKCATPYEDEDPEPYYCATCNEERKVIAAGVDAKLAGRVTKSMQSDLQAYANAPKVRGFADARYFF